MYGVNVMYPRTTGRFDLDHYMNVHVPLGAGSLWRYEGIKPRGAWFYMDPYGMDRRPESSPYHLISTHHYDTKEEADAFIRLFEDPEVSKMLADDWPKYTDAAPICVLARVEDARWDDAIERSDAVLGAAGAPVR
jgi:hypothetical protein